MEEDCRYRLRGSMVRQSTEYKIIYFSSLLKPRGAHPHNCPHRNFDSMSPIPPRHAKTPGVAAILQPRGRCGRLYVRRFLRMGPKEPLLPPKTTMEMSVHRVHGRSDPPPVSPTPPTSTQRRHGHIDRVGRGGRWREAALLGEIALFGLHSPG